MSFKPIDPKRDEIRRYLERGSVLDSLTKIFIRVIKERPENPMEYIRNNIGVVRHQHDKYERLSQDLQEAKTEIQRLRAIINSINPEVLQGNQGSHAVIESDNVEPVTGTVAEQVEVPAAPEATNQNSAAAPENTAIVQTDELNAAVENCHIKEENNVVVPKEKIDCATQSSSVQAESSSTTTIKNTE